VGNLARQWEDGGPDGGAHDDSGMIRRGPEWEVVVARHYEDLGWLSQIPDFWQVVVYNKVYTPPPPSPSPPFSPLLTHTLTCGWVSCISYH